MKITYERVPTGTIEQFAEVHDLEMVVAEREVERDLPIGHPSRYCAKFKHADVEDEGCLESMYGNGPSENEAIRDYAKNISLRTLVLNAYTNDRREIKVWRLIDE